MYEVILLIHLPHIASLYLNQEMELSSLIVEGHEPIFTSSASLMFLTPIGKPSDLTNVGELFAPFMYVANWESGMLDRMYNFGTFASDFGPVHGPCLKTK